MVGYDIVTGKKYQETVPGMTQHSTAAAPYYHFVAMIRYEAWVCACIFGYLFVFLMLYYICRSYYHVRIYSY